jgi:type I restriction enzyme S subunit
MRLLSPYSAKSLPIALSLTGGHWGLKMLPSGWVKKKVADLFEVQLGKMLNQSAKEQNPQYEYLGNSDIQWGKINTENLNTMFFSVREIQKFHLVCGDILMCEGGEVGRCAIWNNQKQDILYQKALHRLRSKGKIIPEYFYDYMVSISGTKLLDDFTTKTSIAHLTQEKLLELPVIVPPLPEQKKIAQILSTWDKAITTTEQLIANSQQQKKALMQQLLTGKKRLLDDNGVRFSGEWHRVELGKLLSYEQPTPYLVESTEYSDKYEIPVLTAGKTFILGYTNETFGVYQQPHPVIIFDDFTTDSKFVNFPFKAKSSAMKILTANEGVSIKFVFESMQMMDFSVGGHQRHWISIFSYLVINLPCLEEQQKIASVLSSADREIELLQSKLTALKQEKKALMQQLLTGKRRVLVHIGKTEL